MNHTVLDYILVTLADIGFQPDIALVYAAKCRVDFRLVHSKNL